MLWAWRAWVLQAFGCKIHGRVFVHPSVRIKMPWNLELCTGACLAPLCEVYNLANVHIGARATIAQEAYLCGGTHDFSSRNMELVVGEIVVGDDVFVAARSFVGPGIHLGKGCVVGACSVVTRDVPAWTIAAGNPCRPIRERVIDK